MASTMTGGQHNAALRSAPSRSATPTTPAGTAGPVRAAGGFAALFAVGTVAAALNGRLPAVGVLICSAVIVAAVSALSVVTAAVPLGVIGWLTVIGFSRPPYADLRPTGATAAAAAITMAACALGGAVTGLLFRYWPRGSH